MADSANNPHLQKKDGGPEDNFTIGAAESALFDELFGFEVET